MPITASTLPTLMPSPPAITFALPALVQPEGPAERFLFIAKVGSAGLLILLACIVVGSSLAPRPIPPVMQRAGQEFVVAFAEPLIDSSSGVPPIRARLRFIRHQQLEISIAPGFGRRYPNLIDHKSNVEYDVARVMQTLGPHFVVSDRLRAAGMWVIVRIRLADLKQTGAI